MSLLGLVPLAGSRAACLGSFRIVVHAASPLPSCLALLVLCSSRILVREVVRRQFLLNYRMRAFYIGEACSPPCHAPA